MNYIFNGLKEWDAHPHYLEDFTKGKIYHIYFDEDETRLVKSDKNNTLQIGNNKLRDYFIKTI